MRRGEAGYVCISSWSIASGSHAHRQSLSSSYVFFISFCYPRDNNSLYCSIRTYVLRASSDSSCWGIALSLFMAILLNVCCLLVFHSLDFLSSYLIWHDKKLVMYYLCSFNSQVFMLKRVKNGASLEAWGSWGVGTNVECEVAF